MKDPERYNVLLAMTQRLPASTLPYIEVSHFVRSLSSSAKMCQLVSYSASISGMSPQEHLIHQSNSCVTTTPPAVRERPCLVWMPEIWWHNI